MFGNELRYAAFAVVVVPDRPNIAATKLFFLLACFCCAAGVDAEVCSKDGISLGSGPACCFSACRFCCGWSLSGLAVGEAGDSGTVGRAPLALPGGVSSGWVNGPLGECGGWRKLEKDCNKRTHVRRLVVESHCSNPV